MQATRQRVFYRDDKKKEMPTIFMSNDDQENCRFEPEAGSLNPKFWSLPSNKFPVPQHLLETADTEQAFQDKMGTNLQKSNPEIYKKGILKKALRFYKKGEFKMAMGEIMGGFKISSLRRHFAPEK